MGGLDVEAFERCIAEGGIAIFPTDTVYGVGCSSEDAEAIKRVHLIKGREQSKPSATMYFSLQAALDHVTGTGRRTRAALERLLPGPVTVVIDAAGQSRGLRVPRLEGRLEPLAAAKCAVFQTSANVVGGPDARRLPDVAPELREAVDLQLDGGELPGIASTVVDLSRYDQDGSWRVLREGAMSAERIARVLE
ncbi:MAG: Sua5/YciO/YrdC/YwlC family protein [Solirubrobacterales bacterium]